MKRLSYLLVFFVICLGAKAQRITVESFKPLPFDMTASSLEGKKIDQNGEIAALIKIVTSETGFAFDAGTLGVVDSKQKIGEVWVWVPRGSRKISIFHQQLGILRDYRYPVEIEAERTYEMVLVTGKVETVVKQEVRQQYLAFQITPPNATLEVNDRIWEVDGEGSAMKYVEFGTYTYRVQASGYYSDAGQVTVNDPENTQIVTVTLNPNFGWIEITGDGELNGASVYIDSDYIGKAPCKSKALKSGQHTLRVVKEMFENYTETVTVNDNETTRITPALKSDFALVTMTVDANAEIWVNNMRKGVRSWSGRLARGTYKIECRQAGYEDTQTILEVTEDMTEKTVTLQPPRPIYGSLNVETTPNFCNLYVDGENKGTTPKSISEILVGKHQIRLTKDGYAEYREDITITKGERYQIRANLNKLSTQAETDKPVSGVNSHSDFLGEGMWLPYSLNNQNLLEMQSFGCKLTAEQICDFSKPSIKDAIVQFGGGCTGEIISPEGLLLTNYHCALSFIQKLSSSKHDYITDGFWARNRNEEIPLSGLSVSFLRRVVDKTKEVLKDLNEGMTEEKRQEIINKNIKAIKDSYPTPAHHRVEIESFYKGNQYLLFEYVVYEDVRLVGGPPHSIGRFGFDTDNWRWPRQKGDFCLFRVYTDKQGNPATYSNDNVPMKPQYYFPISLDGVKKDDFTMILGYPGFTDRYASSYGVRNITEEEGPAIIECRSVKMEIYRKYMDANNDVFVKYVSKQASVSNYLKYYMGQVEQFKNNKVFEKCQAKEKEFKTWVNADPKRKSEYGKVFDGIEKKWQILDEIEKSMVYHREAGWNGGEAISFSRSFIRINNKIEEKADKTVILAEAEKLRPAVASFFKDYVVSLDQDVTAALLNLFYRNIPQNKMPSEILRIGKENNGDFSSFIAKAFEKSVFTNQARMEKWLQKPKKLDKDPIFSLAVNIIDSYRQLYSRYDEAKNLGSAGERLFLKGLMEMENNRVFYPDANFTMRLSYGSVQGYKEFDYYCTAQSMIAKYIPGDAEFDVPQRLRDLVEARNYGRYADAYGNLDVSFISTNDITGGNSGSPILNKNGELVGIVMDGNWENIGSDIWFDSKLQRCINVDIRYVLFIIDKYAGATNILNELNIH
ncbi:MAG: S46 family peptidase [Bacteroidales bacterium]|nr:S46 family peptidase [Bacteroidales bacterium]